MELQFHPLISNSPVDYITDNNELKLQADFAFERLPYSVRKCDIILVWLFSNHDRDLYTFYIFVIINWQNIYLIDIKKNRRDVAVDFTDLVLPYLG